MIVNDAWLYEGEASFNYTLKGTNVSLGQVASSCTFVCMSSDCERDLSMPVADKHHKVKYYLRQRRAPARVTPQYAPPPATGRYHPYQQQ